MKHHLNPIHILVIALAGWINRNQQAVIDYLIAENRVLKEKCKGKRIRLSDSQRRLLAAKAKVIGRKMLSEIETLVTPETLLSWHRKLIARKWKYKQKRVGRPGISQEVVDLVVRFARENTTWGYDRIQGALGNLGYHVALNTVKNVLKQHGIEPAPERKKYTSWKAFLRVHWNAIAATDFFTVEVWTARGLTTYYVLFFMHLSTRSVKILGVSENPDTAFMKQIARNLVDVETGFLRHKKFLIMDRDTKYGVGFRGFLTHQGIKPVRCPVRAPNCNAYAERFVRSIKCESLDQMILFGEYSLRRVLKQYLMHYQQERNHQGVGNRLLEQPDKVQSLEDPVRRQQRLGGMLNYYYREAA